MRKLIYLFGIIIISLSTIGSTNDYHSTAIEKNSVKTDDIVTNDLPDQH
ncbi:hypothetical protein GLW08_21350 [Pontibacillus yanchengensis]|uniref:Uncharacterized protein n=2 Tax=Pontibacillus yanchengensis TaxID=462910 RepID=A0A6I5A517_9BACI|nr:hypothetical protein [Pontibacillus yanchengensis]MYL35431.1 hypothetical protein [Pontibacillus yanchengensis]MYL55850.1 hypothetical protein [Pontibacillus yanchengensis]